MFYLSVRLDFGNILPKLNDGQSNEVQRKGTKIEFDVLNKKTQSNTKSARVAATSHYFFDNSVEPNSFVKHFM